MVTKPPKYRLDKWKGKQGYIPVRKKLFSSLGEAESHAHLSGIKHFRVVEVFDGKERPVYYYSCTHHQF